MAKFRSFRDLSKEKWGTSASNDELKNADDFHDRLQTGALERIADATEAMAKSHTDLIEYNEILKRRLKRSFENNQHLWRSNYALRGHITRLRKKVNNLNELLNIKHK